MKASRGMGAISPSKMPKKKVIHRTDNPNDVDLFAKGGKVGLYANIHKKQARIAAGSGEHMRKVGSKGAPTKEAFIQSALIRLGYELGDIDGNIGAKTNAALQKAGIKATSKDEIVLLLEDKLQAQFPAEYSTSVVENSYDNKPSHLDI